MRAALQGSLALVLVLVPRAVGQGAGPPSAGSWSSDSASWSDELGGSGSWEASASWDGALEPDPEQQQQLSVIVRSAVPIAPAAMKDEIRERFDGRLRVVSSQSNSSVSLGGIPGTPAEWSAAAARFCLRRGIAAPVLLTESAVAIEDIGAGRRLRRLQASGGVAVDALVVGPADHDLGAIAADDFAADAAQAAQTATAALVAGTLSAPGVDCADVNTDPPCAAVNTLAGQLVTEAQGGRLVRTALFTQRFEVVETLTAGSGGATQLTPQLVAAAAAAATGASAADFTVEVIVPQGSPSPAPVPPPEERDGLVLSPEMKWVLIGLAGLAGVVCICAVCGFLIRRTARIGGMRDGSGVGMERAKRKAAALRQRAQETTYTGAGA